ncbi:DNA cytosine methyltransferase [Helicobacter pylori]|nr:DNA cytosine methyltransferase [Helicobacter pylori]RVY86912.1 DNA cytosine methyltransferase [Helicobacter pylori]
MLFNQTLTYISLFSGAGVGCYGLLEEGFECVATVATNEILDSILKPLNKN